MCVCICVYAYKYVCICMYVCMYVCECVFMCVWMCVYLCMYVCMYVCIFYNIYFLAPLHFWLVIWHAMYNWYLQWLFLLLFGVHPPVSSCLIAVLLMFYSVSWVNFFTFIRIFRDYSFFYLVFILQSPVLLLYSWCFIPFHVLISLILSTFFLNFANTL
jgi:hypothetical protein